MLAERAQIMSEPFCFASIGIGTSTCRYCLRAEHDLLGPARLTDPSNIISRRRANDPCLDFDELNQVKYTELRSSVHMLQRSQVSERWASTMLSSILLQKRDLESLLCGDSRVSIVGIPVARSMLES